jgi:hypothetical protein
MQEFAKIEDHEAQALERQVEFFKDKVNFEKLITVLSSEIQAFEDTVSDFNELRSVSTATGIQLDHVGEYLNVLRNSRTDENYRLAILTESATLSNGGQAPFLISTFKTLLDANKVISDSYFPATVIMIAELDDLNIENQDAINAAMQRIKGAGIELEVGFTKSGEGFRFSSLTGQTGDRGFASGVATGDGGRFASLLRDSNAAIYANTLVTNDSFIITTNDGFSLRIK